MIREGLPPLDADAVALQLVWVIPSRNRYRMYEPVTFPNGWAGCRHALNRAYVGGGPPTEDSNYLVDVLDANGDNIQTYTLTRKGFRYLQRQLNVRVIPDEELGSCYNAKIGEGR